MKRLRVLEGTALMAIVSATALAAYTPQPGTVNYIEGAAFVGGRPITDVSGGTIRLTVGEALSTQNGRAEILLTPGIFLRVADRSNVEMVSAGLADTIATLRQGRALVEVAAIRPENNVVVNAAGSNIRLLKPGLYDFDAEHRTMRVFDGKAAVQQNGQHWEVSGAHQLALEQGLKVKAQRFEKNAYEDDFYRWASLRASYVADANVDAAGRYSSEGREQSWTGSGWYWDPWFDSYTFIPSDGIFYSPFGWGFYSPWSVWSAPYLGYWGGWGHHHFTAGYRPKQPVRYDGFGGHAGYRAGGRVAGGPIGRSQGIGFRAGSVGGFHGASGFRGGGGGFRGGGHR